MDVAGVTRMVDTLLESEIMRQESSYGQVSQELSLLSTVETTSWRNSPTAAGLNATIDTFFDSLRALAAHPLERVPRNEVLSSAQVLTSEFRRLGTSLTSMEDQIVLEAQNVVDSINSSPPRSRSSTARSRSSKSAGAGGANNLRDQRDRMIAELSRLIGVETQPREYGIVDVAVAGVPVVTGSMVVDLTVGLRTVRPWPCLAGGRRPQPGGRKGGGSAVCWP